MKKSAAVYTVSDQDVHEGSTAAVGRVGRLDLDYVRREGRTVLAHSSCTTPWHFLPPIELENERAAYTLLVNPSGGLVGGDHLTIHARVGDGAHALFSTPSANRVYRSSVGTARQTMRLEVGSDARAEWVPEPAIPYAGSRYAQSFEITVARGGVLWFWETLASGRMARGERWAFTEFSSDIRITAADGRRMVERMRVEAGRANRGVGLASEWDYVASAFLVADQVGESVLADIHDEAALAFDSFGSELLGGVSHPAAPGLAIKLMAKSGDGLRAAQDRIWEVVRRRLWNRGLPPLRKY